MIEETARIAALQDDFAWVETQRKSTCSACAVNKGCGTVTLAKVLGARRALIKVLNSLAAGIGDEVVIGLEEHAIVQGSLAVYAAPLVFMLAAALPGEGLSARLASRDDGNGETHDFVRPGRPRRRIRLAAALCQKDQQGPALSTRHPAPRMGKTLNVERVRHGWRTLGFLVKQDSEAPKALVPRGRVTPGVLPPATLVHPCTSQDAGSGRRATASVSYIHKILV